MDIRLRLVSLLIKVIVNKANVSNINNKVMFVMVAGVVRSIRKALIRPCKINPAIICLTLSNV